MLYAVLRWIAGIALRWFYRDIEIVGFERIPRDGPVLLASNHPNALVDALVVGHVMPRRVTLTAKATLLDHPVTRALVRAVGIVPLRRSSDEKKAAPTSAQSAAVPDPGRNTESFDAVVDALAAGGAVLLFPEGKSHSAPEIAPLRTGLARMALQAMASGRVARLPIVPVGLTFEQKWAPRSSVLVSVGEPIVLERASLTAWTDDVRALTDRVDGALRAVTMNFETVEVHDQVLEVSRPLVSLLEGLRPLDASDAPMRQVVSIAARLDGARRMLASVDDAVRERVALFLERLAALQHHTHSFGIALADVAVETSPENAVRFVGRELLIGLVVLPAAIWGRINHWLPLRLARWYAQRASRNPDDPAMNTIVSGLVLVLLFYAAQTLLVARLAGGWMALLYLLSLPGSASCDFWYRDRMARARQRARAYLLFRQDPALHASLAAEGRWLRDEALALSDRMNDPAAVAGTAPRDPSATPPGARRSADP